MVQKQHVLELGKPVSQIFGKLLTILFSFLEIITLFMSKNLGHYLLSYELIFFLLGS
uniref:Uncharacterized protein n=1 Tax=Nelumbo nucifera TaxID=4432 RepID=A0A822Y188_NELNU|nr:TPA_asm: hypothetical protein HUJ06_026513 [Nelumbo nucifera]